MAFNDSINQSPSDWQESNHWENLIPEYSRSSDASSSFSQETSIQRFTTEEASVQDDTSVAENPAQDKDAQDEDEQNLEILAREIYSLVQQRLAIERERYGHYYRG
jgi:predicted Mrr-cat superfamily restriction endonuclease